MKTLFSLLSFATLALSNAAFAENHVPANNCEIFIDKITPYGGSHALRAANVWIKVLPQRLDGAIVEVGFRNIATGNSGSLHLPNSWDNRVLQNFAGAQDYFETNFPISSDFGAVSYEGAFYVKTSNDKYYWAKTNSGNFIFDHSTYDNVMNIKGANYNYSGNIGEAVATQSAGMEYYNPSRCR